MNDPSLPPMAPVRPRRLVAPSLLTLVAGLTCFGGSLGAVLDGQSSAGTTDRVVERERTPVAGAETRYPADVYEPILAVAASADVQLAEAAPTAEPAEDGTEREADAKADEDVEAPDVPLPGTAGPVTERLITVGQGDTLSGVLSAAGVTPTDRLAVLQALRPLFDPRGLRTGETISVAFEADADEHADGRLIRLGIALDSRRRAVVHRGNQDDFAASVHDLATNRAPVRADGVIASSLFAAAARAGVPDPVVREMIRAFSYEIDFQRDLRNGDRFSLMFEQIRAADGTVLESGDLLFAGMVVGGEAHKLYRHVRSDGGVDYYTADGSSVRTTLLRTPVNGARLSSGYGMRRHPVLGYSRMHRGIDFAAPIGTPIYAAGDGRIEVIGRNAGYGKYIRIDHKGGYATAYGHLSRFARGLKRNSIVKQGDIIGYVGNTGLSTGPHLHYEILVDGQQVNPLKVEVVRQARLDDAEMARFAATRASIDQDYARLGGIGAIASTTANDSRSAVAR